MSEPIAAKNTDREIWREKPDDYYSSSIHVTEHGEGIGINVGGYVFVKPVREWHRLAKEHESVDALIAGALRGVGHELGKRAFPMSPHDEAEGAVTLVDVQEVLRGFTPDAARLKCTALALEASIRAERELLNKEINRLQNAYISLERSASERAEERDRRVAAKARLEVSEWVSDRIDRYLSRDASTMEIFLSVEELVAAHRAAVQEDR